MSEENQPDHKVKSDVWEALVKNLPLPDLDSVLNRPITPTEVYYLLQQFATLAIWDVYNLDSPGELVPLTLQGASPHYHIYDRGCCIVATPKDLFSHERTLVDALNTARAMADEIQKRGWVIEFAGFDKMVRAAWVELQVLSQTQGKTIEILHYNPTEKDLKIVEMQLRNQQTGFAPGQEI